MEDKKPLPLIDLLKIKLSYHQAMAGKCMDAIAAVEANPGFERAYNLVKNIKGSGPIPAKEQE